MSTTITIARPYAKAAFAIAKQEKAIDKWDSFLQMGSQIVNDKRVQMFLQDPRFNIEERCAWLMDACASTITEEGKNFLKLLASKQRLMLLPEVAVLFEQYRIEQEKIVNVEVISAAPLNSTQQKALEQALKIRLQRDVVLETQVDSNLIGGLIIKAEDLVIDGSLRGKLSRLHEALID